jgi:hypothetical protein
VPPEVASQTLTHYDRVDVSGQHTNSTTFKIVDTSVVRTGSDKVGQSANRVITRSSVARS